MDAISGRKIHFAPYARQAKAVARLIREGDARDVTHLMRRALDYYLEARGRPPLAEQASQMAEEFDGSRRPIQDLQDAARGTDESW